uniref:RNA helicase n=1 Tax=Spodoptera frugiperda TaxID=7108 RepID=A0A2H1X2J2_SPOFR
MVFSLIKSVYNYFFSKSSFEEYDRQMEIYLAEELTKLALDDDDDIVQRTEPEHNPSDCFQRTGVVSYIDEHGSYVLIDGMFYFNMEGCSIHVAQNDKVVYLCYKEADESIVVVRILQNLGEHWGDFEVDVDERGFPVREHVIVGEVEYRQDRMVIIKESDLSFSLDKVVATFVPVQGDLLELMCKVKYDEDNPTDVSSNQVVEVISFRPLRHKVVPSEIKQWNGKEGICHNQIYFNISSCMINGGEPHVGAKTFIEAIESNQGSCSWRVLKMEVTDKAKVVQDNPEVDNIEKNSLEIEANNNIEVTYPLKFDNVRFHERPQITLTITNRNNQPIIMYKWIVLCRKKDSQITMYPVLPKYTKLYPNEPFNLTIDCHPKFYGKSKEHVIISFKGFKVERLIEINVLSELTSSEDSRSTFKRNNTNDTRTAFKRGETNYVPGVRLAKNPNFRTVRMGQYNIPEKVESAILGDNERLARRDILQRIEYSFPCLIQNLNVSNYVDKWHTLLYMEEIKATINVRSFNMPSTFLLKNQEYLSLEIKKLAERRPSLIVGDRVIVTDMWDENSYTYEGFIHVIRGDQVLFKFNPRFHESYRGSDVSVEFCLSRASYRKLHHAISKALSTLGTDVLFPSRLISRPPQLPLEKINNLKWFNPNLNYHQKKAIRNILIGECRPMPYCIYGPPGTGKTVTVVETLLQIITLIPDSRILVATPSNSAANLITERLLQYRKLFSSSIIRLIANYMIDSENIPDVVKPYCAVLNIAREKTSMSHHAIVENGINMNVPSSYVGRYRVTIGTCNCLGTLALMELHKGHYTHVIIDEAGQAIEPEIMIPMTFINKESGQIILSGDPMQLGPIVLSDYCKEYGMDKSYLSRLLETFPYQKDFAAFENGFNEKLVTRLTENYRSLQEVIKLPSEMFYDASLVSRVDRNAPFVTRIIDVMSEIFDMPEDSKTGGVFVHGVKGNNARAADSPSWYNPEEASTIAMIVCKLYKSNISPDEIGIIAPYVAQIRHLRRLFEHMHLDRPKIGTVEEFQGQERSLVIISTVRSSSHLIEDDLQHSLGFVENPKRLNVALTRAQVAVMLICDPHLLSHDPKWNKIITHAINENKYMGCDFSGCNETKELQEYFEEWDE